MYTVGWPIMPFTGSGFEQDLPTCVQPLGREEAYASLASRTFAAVDSTNAPAKKLMNFTNGT